MADTWHDEANWLDIPCKWKFAINIRSVRGTLLRLGEPFPAAISFRHCTMYRQGRASELSSYIQISQAREVAVAIHSGGSCWGKRAAVLLSSSTETREFDSIVSLAHSQFSPRAKECLI